MARRRHPHPLVRGAALPLPTATFPYAALLAECARRGRDVAEYELADTGVLDGDRFFDVRVVHAKAAPDDVCVEVSATNHGPDAAALHLVPQLTPWRRFHQPSSAKRSSGKGS